MGSFRTRQSLFSLVLFIIGFAFFSFFFPRPLSQVCNFFSEKIALRRSWNVIRVFTSLGDFYLNGAKTLTSMRQSVQILIGTPLVRVVPPLRPIDFTRFFIGPTESFHNCLSRSRSHLRSFSRPPARKRSIGGLILPPLYFITPRLPTEQSIFSPFSRRKRAFFPRFLLVPVDWASFLPRDPKPEHSPVLFAWRRRSSFESRLPEMGPTGVLSLINLLDPPSVTLPPRSAFFFFGVCGRRLHFLPPATRLVARSPSPPALTPPPRVPYRPIVFSFAFFPSLLFRVRRFRRPPFEGWGRDSPWSSCTQFS